jgi:hypothetical protein
MIVHFINRNTRKLEGQVIESNEFPLFPVSRHGLKKGLYIPRGPTGPCYKFLAKGAELQIRQGIVSGYQAPNFVHSNDKIRLREGDGDVVGTDQNGFIATRLV